ncbi:MAG: hypothetical protein KDJ37_17750 [Hyphomicrobiaceae bacterium]|nr:hypothetical protein [Hyphomicrobiaceae bacterium]
MSNSTTTDASIGSAGARGDVPLLPASRDAPLKAPPATAAVTGPVLYRASGGRRFAFTAIFLLLLPFYVSLGPMLWARISQGHWTGTTGLVVLAAAFTFVMFLILVEMLNSIRSKVELGTKALRLTLPSGRGPQPMLRYASHEIAYDDISEIETRREVYGGALAPMMLKGARIVLKDGTKVRLGYVNEANVDPAFPFPEIAMRIANRAGVPIIDRGNVRRSAPKKMLGIVSAPRENRTIDEQQMAELNKKHTRLMIVLFAGLAVLVTLGIVGDMMQPG